MLERDHTQSLMFEVRRKESEHMDEEAVGLASFTTIFPLEDGANCEPCGFFMN